MKQYFTHLKSKTTHERRRHAAGMAGAVTAVITLAWMASLSYAVPTHTGTVAADGSSPQDQFASAIQGIAAAGGAGLQVSTTSVLGQ